MKTIRIGTLFAGVALALFLGACGTQSDCDNPESAPTVHSQPVVFAGGYAGQRQLKCAPEFNTTRLAIGTHNEPAIADYKLTETTVKSDDYGQSGQVSVTLKANVPAGWKIPSSIVHAADSPDKEFPINLGPEGSVNTTLLTKEFAAVPDYFGNYPITGITLCIVPA